MRKFIFFAVLLLSLSTVLADECKIVLKPRGVWQTYCPAGTLMDANGTNINIVGQSVFVRDNVRCVEPVLECKKDEKEIDNEL